MTPPMALAHKSDPVHTSSNAHRIATPLMCTGRRQGHAQSMLDVPAVGGRQTAAHKLCADPVPARHIKRLSG
jgi:hypothetical protein